MVMAVALLVVIAASSPMLVLLAAGVELSYLGVAPRVGAFRRAVDAREERLKRAEAVRRRAELLTRMSEMHRGRLEDLERRGDEIRANIRRRGEAVERLLSAATASISDLTAAYARSAVLHEAYRQQVSCADARRLAAEVASLESAPSPPGPREEIRLRRLAVARARAERLERAGENLQLAAQNLALLEELFDLLYERSLAPAAPSMIAVDVDGIAADLGVNEDDLFELSDGPDDVDASTLELGRGRVITA